MRTLLSDPPPPGVQALLERRRRLGLDRRDEVWEGVVHVVPGPSGEHSDLAAEVKALLRAPAIAAGLTVSDDFNLGDSQDDFRVPDGGLHRTRPHGAWLPTAALVIEILSPGDETWSKLPFYAAHGVDELLIVDPDARKIHWFALSASQDVQAPYELTDRSRLIESGPAELSRRIDWP